MLDSLKRFGNNIDLIIIRIYGAYVTTKMDIYKCTPVKVHHQLFIVCSGPTLISRVGQNK